MLVQGPTHGSHTILESTVTFRVWHKEVIGSDRKCKDQQDPSVHFSTRSMGSPAEEQDAASRARLHFHQLLIPMLNPFFLNWTE